ncbi:MAG TPA: STAS domain-containing protein [Myxococcota bacterium]|jgi:anti-anti-sigma regulatory factor|nr:STAS domain-containing protein [Myxococcota bacterium]
MLRITRSDLDADLTTLELEGRLLARDVTELERSLAEALASDRRVVLDLCGVTYVDAASAEALVGLRRKGVALAGCSPFVRELLKEVSS